MVLWTREKTCTKFLPQPSYHKMQGRWMPTETLQHGSISDFDVHRREVEARRREKPEHGEFGTGLTIPLSHPNIRIEYTLAESSVPRAWWRRWSIRRAASWWMLY